MNGSKDVLDRLEPLFAPPERPYEGFLRHRDRKRRNQRIAAAVVALLIAVAAIGGAFAVFRSAERERPASPTPITPQNISRLKLAWAADTGGSAWPPAVADGVVYAGTWEVGSSGSVHLTPSGHVYAFSEDCATGGEACAPLWSARTGSVNGPTVANGVVYVAQTCSSCGNPPQTTGPKGAHHLFAFNADCGTGGAVCVPRWVGNIGAGVGFDMIKPVVVGNTVYVATDTLYAFPVGCRPVRGICAPLWTAPIGAPASAIAVGDGRVFVGTASGDSAQGGLLAFSTDCGTGGSTCAPLWKRSNIDGVWGLTEDSGVLYVGTSTSLFAIPADCGDGASCSPLWTAAPRADGGYWVGPVVDGTLFVFDQNFGVYAFPADCGTGGAMCQPTWSGLVPPRLSSAPPVVADGVVYVGTQTGQVYAFPTACSDPCRWIWTVGETTLDDWVGVTVADGKVFVAAAPARPIPDALSAYAVPRTSAPVKGGTDRGTVWLYAALALIAAVALVVRLRRRRAL